MKLACIQPSYAPWLGYFAQMAWCDAFIFLDDVLYSKNDWRNRNRIKTSQGVQWLTVPVKLKGLGQPLIKDVLIDNSTDWKKKHFKSICQNYSKAPYFKNYIGLFYEFYNKDWEKLVDLNVATTIALATVLKIKPDIGIFSSLDIKGDRIQRLVDCCLKLGATEFMEGSAGRDYLTGEGEELFKRNGIKLIYQDYRHPVYPQLYGDFVEKLSILDLIFNCGPDSLRILSGGNEYESTRHSHSV